MSNVKTVTMDSGADRKALNRLAKRGLIEFSTVDIDESGSQSLKIKNRILPQAIFPFRLGHAVLGNESTGKRWNSILSIMGKENLNDAKIIDAHLNSKRDILVSEDTDILNKRQELYFTFPNLKIMSTQELVKHFYSD